MTSLVEVAESEDAPTASTIAEVKIVVALALRSGIVCDDAVGKREATSPVVVRK